MGLLMAPSTPLVAHGEPIPSLHGPIFPEELRWTKPAPDQNAHCQSIIVELTMDHPWAIIVQSMKVTLMGSIFTGRYGNAMRIIKMSPMRRQFITLCFLESLERNGWRLKDCESFERK
jgi:hypothetical protein